MGGFRSAADQLLMLTIHAGQLCLISGVKKKGGGGVGGGDSCGKAACHLQIHKLAQVYQVASLQSLSELRELRWSISFDYQTGLINGSFFSILSN